MNSAQLNPLGGWERHSAYQGLPCPPQRSFHKQGKPLIETPNSPWARLSSLSPDPLGSLLSFPSVWGAFVDVRGYLVQSARHEGGPQHTTLV